MERITAILNIAHNLNDVLGNLLPASLTGSTLQFAEMIQPLPNQLTGKHAYIYDGAGMLQRRVIGSFNPAANELVFPHVFASIPSTNSAVLITDKFSHEDYDRAVSRFVGKARTMYLEDMVATTAIVATQYEYAVPSGMEWIETIRIIPSGNTDYGAVSDVRKIWEIPPRYWRIEANQGGSYVISFDPRKINLDNFDGDLVDIKGQSKPDIGGAPTAVIPANLEEFVIAGATMLLASQRINEKQEWTTKFYMFRDLYRPLEDYIFRYGRGKKVAP